jgi:FG-GAP repeat
MNPHRYPGRVESLGRLGSLCHWLAALLALSAGSLSTATTMPGIPSNIATSDPAMLAALQNAVAETMPASSELAASNGAHGDNFGDAVAISGTTALVGAYFKGNLNGSTGAVYVFTFDGSTWVQQQELTASDGAADDRFGTSVALSGNTALIGAEDKTIGSNSDQGAAYVFTFNGSNWVQQQRLAANDGGLGDFFGSSVAVSGTTALVGASGKTIGSNTEQGAAYVFTSNGSVWSQQQELTASDGAGHDNFGSVALLGTTALVGASGKTIGSNSDQGAVYVFSSNGSTWNQQQELLASDGAASDSFGISLALSDTSALVGALSKTIGANAGQGAAYVFTLSGDSWTQQQELISSDGAANDFFGGSVALSGTMALVGADYKTIGSNPAQGATYVFTSNGNTWTQRQELTASDGAAADYFGTAVALSGTTALVGAPLKTLGTNNDQGVAYVFNPAADLIFCDGFDGAGLCK